jgi:putative transposase
VQSRAGYDPPVMAKAAQHLLRRILTVSRDLASLVRSVMRSGAQLAAENVFLRKPLALYLERRARPRRADDATRIVLAGLSRLLEWRQLLVIVEAETLIRWHRKGFRLFWRWKSRAPGRPAIPVDVQRLIATMAASNRTWGEERIANELLLKLGIRLSPRTVRRYIPSRPPRPTMGRQGWSTFVRNHGRCVLASDFFVVVTATFRILYVFVVLEVGTRRIVHWNVTAHPTADSTAQQFRMIVRGDQAHRFVVHDCDRIYSDGVDRTLQAMGLTVLKTPALATSECLLRTRDRHDAPRMLGLHGSNERTARSRDSSRVGPPRQPRSATRELGTRHSGSFHRCYRRPCVRRPLGSSTLLSRGKANPERPPSRVPA